MLFLRLFLFMGLVFHKLVWEYKKRQAKSSNSTQRAANIGLTKTLLKLTKNIALIFMLIQTLFLNIFPISMQPLFFNVLGVLLFSVGLVIAVIGRLQLGENWENIEDYKVLPGQSLVSSGIYTYIRHPIYFGDVILVLGLELALNSWLFLGVILLMVYVYFQARAEENMLKNVLPGYKEYCGVTKMFIPYVL